jgi:hypothetical protein
VAPVPWRLTSLGWDAPTAAARRATKIAKQIGFLVVFVIFVIFVSAAVGASQ